MSYDDLNIGQLLFLLPNAELKQRVRNLERFYKHYISAKTGIIFNKTIYIYILYIEFDPYRLSILEALYIKKFHRTINIQVSSSHTTLKHYNS